jgi:hypothetical protein
LCIWGWMTSSPFAKKSISCWIANHIDGDHSAKGGVDCRRFFLSRVVCSPAVALLEKRA